jgi:nitroreductase
MEHERVRNWRGSSSTGGEARVDRNGGLLSAGGRRRRWFLVASAAVGAGVVGARAIPLDDESGQDAYDEAVRSTWRHSESLDLAWPAVQRELVRYATLAANNHNSQPWRFGLSDQGIVVVPDFGRRGPGGDSDGHELYVSLGCAVENMVQAAEAFGLRAIPSFDGGSRRIPVAVVAGTRRRGALFDAIPHRSSAREEFDGRPVAAEHLRLLEAAGTGEGVSVLLIIGSRRLDEIVGYVSAAIGIQMDDANFLHDLKLWIRFNYRETVAARDGLFVKSYGHRILAAPIGRILLDLSLNRNTQCLKCEKQIRSAAGVAVFVPERNDPAHWVEAGRCSQRFALQATALGIQTSFINQEIEVPAVREQFAAYLGVGARRPDVMVRFGHGPEAPRSLRRPVEQVIFRA